MKRFLIALLCLTFLVGILGLTACGAGGKGEQGSQGEQSTPGQDDSFEKDEQGGENEAANSTEGVLYNVVDGKAVVAGYEGTAVNINIAEIYEGVPVTEIGEEAFYKASNIETVIIPDGVTYIDHLAFSECDNLTSVSIPDSVSYIGISAFDGCEKLQYATYGNAKYLGNASNEYLALIAVTATDYREYAIHQEARIIADFAFQDCKNLTEITVPDSVVAVGSLTFNGCPIVSATIPAIVTPCLREALQSVVITSGDVEASAFNGCSSLTSLTIGGGVNSIGNFAFAMCTGLTSITIEVGVNSIGEWAFASSNKFAVIDFKGTVAEWNAISKGEFWNRGTGAYTVICTDGKLDKDGNTLK